MFVLCEQSAMTIADLRKELGLSLETFAELLGLSSKGYASDLEKKEGVKPSVKVALKLEELSGGKIDAASLNEDVRLVREADAPQAAA
jgi:transcriptional regulator with XRE-family HTH domain